MSVYSGDRISDGEIVFSHIVTNRIPESELFYSLKAETRAELPIILRRFFSSRCRAMLWSFCDRRTCVRKADWKLRGAAYGRVRDGREIRETIGKNLAQV